MNDLRWKRDSLSGVMERGYILPYLCVMLHCTLVQVVTLDQNRKAGSMQQGLENGEERQYAMKAVLKIVHV